MSTLGQFNTKNPTIKRILKEASELANNVSPDFHAEPLEDNLFEWHFTLRGPPSPSPYADGLYHGRIILPSEYPLRPPSFRFLTPSGRFEVNREICLSISGHHEETWQPAWGIRTALVAIRSFMDTGAKGQVGGLECDEGARRRMAKESGAYCCSTCGKTNGEIIKEREEAVKATGEGEVKEEAVPEELRLAYREELGGRKPESSQASSTDAGQARPRERETPAPASSSMPQPPAAPPAVRAQFTPPIPPLSNALTERRPARTVPTPPRQRQQQQQQQQQQHRQHHQQAALDPNAGVPAWVDKAIWTIIGALVFMILRKIIL